MAKAPGPEPAASKAKEFHPVPRRNRSPRLRSDDELIRPTGGQPGAMNNFRTSVWACLFTEEEIKFAEQHAWNDLSLEIEITRIRLRRLLIAEAHQMTRDGEMSKAELDEIVTEAYKTKTGKQIGNLMERKKFKRVDFTAQMNLLMGRMESMTRTHKDLQTTLAPDAGEPGSPIGTIRVEVVGAKGSVTNNTLNLPVIDMDSD